MSITGSKFKENASRYGGGVYAAEGSNVLITNSSFSTNRARYGGAIFAAINSVVRIVDTNFAHNTASKHGAAIYADEGSTVYVIANNKNIKYLVIIL